MKLTTDQLQTLAKLAIDAATKAGEMIQARCKETFDIYNKEAGSSKASQVFTEVDLLSEQIIINHLSPTLEKFDLGLLSEERTDDNSRFEKDYFWCIDPLDGTLPFIEQQIGYSVSIALVAQNGIPQIGVIFDPCTNTLYHAIKGGGVFKNKQPWLINDPSSDFTLVCDRSFLQHKRYDHITDQLKSNFGDIAIISQGGAAMNAMWVLERNPACYFKIPKKEDGGGSLWDFAASACIYNELGALASDFDGQPLDLNRYDSTFMNHEGIFYTTNKDLFTEVKQLL